MSAIGKDGIDIRALRKYIEEIVNETLQKVKTADAKILADAIREFTKVFMKYVEKIDEDLRQNRERITRLEEELRLYREHIEKLARAVEDLQKAIHDLQRTISVIGYRYGVYTEDVFRSSIKYLIEDLLKVYRVEKWSYYDEEGYVYSHPSIIDVDVLISDREHIVVEYKAHADRSDVLELYRIAKLYERVKRVKPKALLVAPTITRKAKELAEKLGIEIRGTVIE